MAEIEFDEWMSDADAALWHAERDPRLRSTIALVCELDAAPDRARFDEAIAYTLAKIPRLRQRVVQDALGLAPPRWEDDPHFDLRFHVRHATLGGQGSLRALLDMAEPIAMQAFDKDRPLWELYLVDGLTGGRAGMILKLHHAVSDGMGLVRMTSALVERTRERDPRKAAPEGVEPESASDSDPRNERSETQRLRDAARRRGAQQRTSAQRLGRALASGAASFLRDPRAAIAEARETVESIARTLRPVDEPLSPIMRERGMALRLSGFTVPLTELKRAGEALGGTLNDAFVTAICGGLRIYHEKHGEPVDALRMTMPINTREGEKGNRAGNQFAPMRMIVPVGIEDARERLREIQGLVREQRAEKALPLVDDIMGAINALPRAASLALIGSMLKAIDFVTSNVPGPRFPVYLAGAKIERMFPFGPPAGAALNVTLYSYDGVCQIGVNCDRAAVPDAELLTECLERGFEEVLAAAR
ncbi:MAG TPA: wax ester/triacylglycerol synthase family O-acyltransferase [Myxococcota bacterium]|nr:wax ester/triacylglycerol synthase family O-acyltransferase [Myxococcota bacterium]